MSIKLINVQRLLADNSFQSCEVLIEDGIIQNLEEKVDTGADEIIDGQGMVLSAGFVDVHVHLREPGGEAKETVETGTKAAAKGGFTTICAMPNTRPVPDSLKNLSMLQNRIKDSAAVRVLPYASITVRQLGEQLTEMEELKKAGAFAFTDDGVGIQSAGMMLEAMKKAAAVQMPIVAHCEDNSLLYKGVVHQGKVSERLNVPGIMAACESVQIARDVLLAEATGCHYHVCHVSTKESVRVIRNAKEAGIHVTAEVTPHHLLLTEDDLTSDDGNYKMNPPLRAKEDQEALLEGLLDGTIDFIATDHAPHTEEEKKAGLLSSPFGIVGLETAFPLLYTHLVKTQKATMYQLLDWLTAKPAEAFHLPYGRLETGKPADLVLLDLEHEFEIDKNSFSSKGKNTPFHGWKVKGSPVMTFVNGKIAWEALTNEQTTTRS